MRHVSGTGLQTTDYGQQTNEKKMESGVRQLENLKIWQQSRALVVEIYKVLQDSRDYGFRDQIQRAAVSIMNNIAEGFEAGSDATFIRYLNISKGSCSEVKSMLYLCSDLNYCSEEIRIKLQSDITAIISGIYNLIKYLEADKK